MITCVYLDNVQRGCLRAFRESFDRWGERVSGFLHQSRLQNFWIFSIVWCSKEHRWMDGRYILCWILWKELTSVTQSLASTHTACFQTRDEAKGQESIHFTIYLQYRPRISSNSHCEATLCNIGLSTVIPSPIYCIKHSFSRVTSWC